MFDLSGIDELIPIVVTFDLSLLIAVVVLIARQSAFVVEIVILGWLTFGFWAVMLSALFTAYLPFLREMADTESYDSTDLLKRTFGLWRLGLLLLVLVAWMCFNFWFYVVGYKSGNFEPTACGVDTFLFSKIHAIHFHRYAIFMSVTTGLYIGLGGLTVLYAIYLKASDVVTHLRHPQAGTSASVAAEASRHDGSDTSSDSDAPPKFVLRLLQNPMLTRRIFAALTSFLYVLAVLGVELVIRWNNVQGVSDLGTAGQLIPFIVSLSGLLRAFRGIFKKIKSSRARKES
jgi:hypothetical protein